MTEWGIALIVVGTLVLLSGGGGLLLIAGIVLAGIGSSKER